ncbi:MAG: ribosomal RNA small subunit methyltransferase A [Desulfamplus sp.]|nr:ribosomal RNA small subunit methyltransferase A [Desulfamplus sp.]
MTYPGTLLKSSNLFARKELGQNFLADPKAAERIVNLAQISKNDVVLEIGAGLGAITVHAAKHAAKVYAVEKDDRLIQLLKDELSEASVDNVELIHKDIFKVDIESIAKEMANINCKEVYISNENETVKSCGTEPKIIVIGNLPYNISSQVLLMLVEKRTLIAKAILMFQKELAERICSPPGGKDYGRLSAIMQYCSRVKTLTDVGANLFFPKPNVESRVIEVNFFQTSSSYNSNLSKPAGDGNIDSSSNSDSSSKLYSDSYNLSPEQEHLLFQVIKAAFSKRRKTLRNAISSSELKIDKSLTEKGLELARIDPERRAETLDVAEFIDLTLSFWHLHFGVYKG